MVNFIIIVILALMIGGAVAYLIKSKRNGVKCVGCPSGGCCCAGGKKKKHLEEAAIETKTIAECGGRCSE